MAVERGAHAVYLRALGSGCERLLCSRAERVSDRRVGGATVSGATLGQRERGLIYLLYYDCEI